MAELGKSLSQLKKKIIIKEDIPLLKIKAGTYDIQRFLYWNFLKCWWSPDVPFDQSVATNYDWYFPKFAYRHSEKEIKKWFKDIKLKIIHFNEIESELQKMIEFYLWINFHFCGQLFKLIQKLNAPNQVSIRQRDVSPIFSPIHCF